VRPAGTLVEHNHAVEGGVLRQQRRTATMEIEGSTPRQSQRRLLHARPSRRFRPAAHRHRLDSDLSRETRPNGHIDIAISPRILTTGSPTPAATEPPDKEKGCPMPDAATLDSENRQPMIPLPNSLDISRLTPVLRAMMCRWINAEVSPEERITAFNNFASAQP
jgi:hypothetical protein